MNLKLFLIALLIVCFANVKAQYKFETPATVSVELSLAQSIVFKKVFDTDRETMVKNKVKKILFSNSRGDVQYLYDEKGRMTSFTIMTSDNNSTVVEIKYDSQNNFTEYLYGYVEAGVKSGETYLYTYDDKGRMASGTTSRNIMMNPGKFYKIIYESTTSPNTPTGIEYYREANSVPQMLYAVSITSDSEGRLTSVKDKEGKNMIRIDYTPAGVDMVYLTEEYPTRYTIENNRVTKINDDFLGLTEFIYKENGLIESCTLTLKSENINKKFVFEYEYY